MKLPIPDRVVRPLAIAAALGVIALTVWVMHNDDVGHAPTGAEPLPSISLVSPSTSAATDQPSAGPSSPPGSPETDDGPATDETVQPSSNVTAGQTDPTLFAADFTRKWLNTSGQTSRQWLSRLRPMLTEQVAEDLADVDLNTVPVGKADTVRVSVAGDRMRLAEVTVTDSAAKKVGAVSLTLVDRDGRWLVSGIDWTPA